MEERAAHILAMAAQLIIHHGYNKTTMSDIADASGISRGLIYVYFDTKDQLFESLLKRELMTYGEAWITYIEEDPQGGSVSSMYRAVLQALNHNAFMSAIVKRDEHVFGKYLRKPGNMFETIPSTMMTLPLLKMMQQAGNVREGINLEAMATIMDSLAYSLIDSIESDDTSTKDDFDDLLETISEMIERMIEPVHGSNHEAGKAILRQLATTARAHFANLHTQSEEAAQE